MSDNPPIDTRFIDDCVAGCAASHQRLLAIVDAIDEKDQANWFGAPSLLDNWTRAHVLAHLARNADSHIHLFAEAAQGVVGKQYPGGGKTRAQGIADDALLTPRELIARVRTSIYGLEGSWARSNAQAWLGSGTNAIGAVLQVTDLPLFRWREVEVHTSDLGVGYTFNDWDEMYVRYDLPRNTMRYTSRSPMGMSVLPDESLALSERERLAWLMGRTVPAGLTKVDGF